jgi:hypothetical protein
VDCCKAEKKQENLKGNKNRTNFCQGSSQTYRITSDASFRTKIYLFSCLPSQPCAAFKAY